MPNRVVYTFIASDKFSKIAQKMADRTSNLSSKMDELRTEAAAASGAVGRVTGKLRKVGLGLIGAGVAFSAIQIPFLQKFAELEKIQVAFELLVGSAEKGRAIFKDLQDFQKGTPFNLVAIKTAGQTLLTFGTKVEDLRIELTALGNITAASGGRIEDLAQVFGKAQTAGRVTLDVINSLALRGVNVMDIWAEKTGASVDKIREAISKGQVPFSVLRETILDLGAREGGRFTGIMVEQSKRLAGAWTRFGGATDIASAKLGGILSKAGKVPEIFDFMTRSVEKVTKAMVAWTERHPLLTSLLARLGTGLIILGVVIGVFSTILSTLAFFMLPILISRILGFSIVMTTLKLSWAAVVIVGKGLLLLFGSLTVASLTMLGVLIVIPLTLFAIIKNFKKIKLVFGFLIADFKEFVGSVAGWITNLEPLQAFFARWAGRIAFVTEKIALLKTLGSGALSSVRESVSGLFNRGEDIQVNASGELTSRSAATVDISLNAPKGVIRSVKSAVTGDRGGLDLGLNMAETA